MFRSRGLCLQLLPTIGVAAAAFEAYHSPKSGVGIPNLIYNGRRNYEEIAGCVLFRGTWHYWFPGRSISSTWAANRTGVARTRSQNRGILGNHGFCENRALLRHRCGPYLFRSCTSEVQQLGRVSRGRAEGPL